MKGCTDTFGELSFIGVLLSRDSEIGGAIVKIVKINTILKRPANKLFPIGNTYQDTKQTGTAREQKLRQEAVSIGEVKR